MSLHIPDVRETKEAEMGKAVGAQYAPSLKYSYPGRAGPPRAARSCGKCKRTLRPLIYEGAGDLCVAVGRSFSLPAAEKIAIKASSTITSTRR